MKTKQKLPKALSLFFIVHLLWVPCCLLLVVMGGLIPSIHPRLSHPHSPCEQLLVVVVGVLCHHPTHDPPYEQWLIGLGHMLSRSPLSPCHHASFFILHLPSLPLLSPLPCLAVAVGLLVYCCPALALLIVVVLPSPHCCIPHSLLPLPLLCHVPIPIVVVLVVVINTCNPPCKQWHRATGWCVGCHGLLFVITKLL